MIARVSMWTTKAVPSNRASKGSADLIYVQASFNLMDQTETEDILLEKGRADTTPRPLEPVEKLIGPGRIPSPGNPRPIPSPAVESVIYIGVHLPEPFRVSEGVPGIVFG